MILTGYRKTPLRDHRLWFRGSVADSNQAAAAPGRECRGKRIEWTGAGGDYFLAVIVDDRDEVVAERWGTRKEIVSWIETRWPQLPKKFVPMALGATQRQAECRKAQPSTRKRNSVLGFGGCAGEPQ